MDSPYNIMTSKASKHKINQQLQRSKNQQSRTQATQMNVLRRIEGLSRLDRVRNVDIREKLRQEGMLNMVKSRQERWRVRMEMSGERTTRKIFEGEMGGKAQRKTEIERD